MFLAQSKFCNCCFSLFVVFIFWLSWLTYLKTSVLFRSKAYARRGCRWGTPKSLFLATLAWVTILRVCAGVTQGELAGNAVPLGKLSVLFLEPIAGASQVGVSSKVDCHQNIVS